MAGCLDGAGWDQAGSCWASKGGTDIFSALPFLIRYKKGLAHEGRQLRSAVVQGRMVGDFGSVGAPADVYTLVRCELLQATCTEAWKARVENRQHVVWKGTLALKESERKFQ